MDDLSCAESCRPTCSAGGDETEFSQTDDRCQEQTTLPPGATDGTSTDQAGSEECPSDEPRRPLDSECCGTGCSPCVFDLYERDLAAWWRRQRQRSPPAAAALTDGPLHPDRYTALELTSITAVSDSSAIYRFALPADTSLRLPVGAHLRLRAEDADGRLITRAYTPVSPARACGYFDVFIRRYRDGAMSRIVDTWLPGVDALWSGPFGGYQPRGGDTRLVLLAAGTGVAPFVSLVRATLEDDDTETRLSLLQSVRRLCDVYPPRDQLAQWAGFWNFTYQLFVSASSTDAEPPRYGEPVHWQRLQREDVQEAVRQSPASTRYLVCGTRAFEKDVLNYLREAGVGDEDVFRF